MIADGRTDQQMAEVMHLSKETIKEHVDHIRAKLGAVNRAHAVAIGFRHSLLPTDPQTTADLATIAAARTMGYRLAVTPWEGE